MQSKSLLIAIAAFAVTATGAQAYVGTKYIDKANLSVTQRDAFSEAKKLKRSGDVEGARDLLVGAGITDETIESMRKAAHESRQALHDAIDDKDFAAFREAVKGTPLYDLVTSEEDFKLFLTAHDLKKEGKSDEAQVIFDDLGIAPKDKSMREGRGFKGENYLELTTEQKDALRAARQANDEETVKAILTEAGISEDKIERRLDKKGWR
jgi:hypothetical protein